MPLYKFQHSRDSEAVQFYQALNIKKNNNQLSK